MPKWCNFSTLAVSGPATWLDDCPITCRNPDSNPRADAVGLLRLSCRLDMTTNLNCSDTTTGCVSASAGSPPIASSKRFQRRESESASENRHGRNGLRVSWPFAVSRIPRSRCLKQGEGTASPLNRRTRGKKAKRPNILPAREELTLENRCVPFSNAGLMHGK